MTRRKDAWVRFAIVIALVAGAALFLRSRGQAEILPPRDPLAAFPLQVGKWKGKAIPIPQWALDVLGAGEFLEQSYSGATDEPSIDLFLAYFPSQRMGSTIHSPQNCLPGSGWTPVDSKRFEVQSSDSKRIKVNRYVLSKGLDKMLVLYWYESHGRAEASEYWAKFYLVLDAIRMNRSDGALVRVMTPVARDETLADAEHRGLAFAQSILPLLGRYIPR